MSAELVDGRLYAKGLVGRHREDRLQHTLKLKTHITPDHKIEVPAYLPVGPVELTLVYQDPSETEAPRRLPRHGQGAFAGRISADDNFDESLPGDMLDAIEAGLGEELGS